MATKTEIINNALVLLGENKVTNIDVADETISNLSTSYDILKASILGGYYWIFAMKWVTPTLSTDKPDDPRYQYSYYIPDDLMLIIETYPSESYTIIGDRIYANIKENWKIRYIHNCDESLFPEPFVLLMSYALAADNAISITEDANLAGLYEKKYAQQLKKCKFLSAQSQTNQPIVYNVFGRG